ncbi:MAG: AAA family ATPase [Thermoplasmata archaeon]
MNSTIVTISGLPGSGTSTAAKLLSKKTGMSVLNSGDIFRNLAKEYGVSLEEFSKMAEKDPSFDLELDSRMIKLAEPGVILEGRLTGQMLHKEGMDPFKVWIEAPLDVRIKRIAGREGLELSYIRQQVMQREKSEFKRYDEYYDIDLADKEIYDLVISSEKYRPEEIVERIMEDAGIEVR